MSEKSYSDSSYLESVRSDEALLGLSHRQPKKSRWLVWSTYLTSGLILLILGSVAGRYTRKYTDQECAAQLSMYSPAIEAVEYIDFDFDDDFNVSSIYRGPPTPEREAAWLDMTYKHGVEIPEDKLEKLNRTEKDHMKHVPPEIGTGYVGILEVFHQLHCLNMVRMYTWYQVGKYPGVPDGLSSNDTLANRMHVDHCIESLRIALQCWGDVTPLLVKIGGPTGGKADFDTHHRCRNFQKIEEWIDNNWTVP